MLAPLVAVLLVGQVEPAGGPKPLPQIARPEELQAIERGWFDPAFRPIPGARGVVAYRDLATSKPIPVLSFTDPFALATFLRAADVGDAYGEAETLRDGTMVRLASGTDVLVIGEGLIPVKLGGAEKLVPYLEARILEGPHAGRKLLVNLPAVKRLLPLEGESPRPEERPVRLQAHAETLLRSGRNLEASGKLEGARAFYARVVKEYPGTDSARTAQDRLRAIGGGK